MVNLYTISEKSMSKKSYHDFVPKTDNKIYMYLNCFVYNVNCTSMILLSIITYITNLETCHHISSLMPVNMSPYLTLDIKFLRLQLLLLLYLLHINTVLHHFFYRYKSAITFYTTFSVICTFVCVTNTFHATTI